MAGKAYANRRSVGDRPVGDFYSTPKSLIWKTREVITKEFDKTLPLLEPCSGMGAISTELSKAGYSVITNDLYKGGVDYLQQDQYNDIRQIITNPPFSLWDKFIVKAKSHADKIMFLGRLNYLGTHGRNTGGIWENLKAVYVFDRYVDYQTPFREDGRFHVGAMATGWFLFETDHREPPELHVIDVQEYATLGAFLKKGGIE